MRQGAGLTQDQLAERLKKPQSYVPKREGRTPARSDRVADFLPSVRS